MHNKNTVAQQKASGDKGRFGFLRNGETSNTVFPAYTDPNDLPAVMVTVELQKSNEYGVETLETVEFNAAPILATWDRDDIQGISEDPYGSGDNLFYEAQEAGFAAKWDGPYECRLDAAMSELDLEALDQLIDARIDETKEYILVDGQYLDRHELILSGLLDEDGTTWETKPRVSDTWFARIDDQDVTLRFLNAEVSGYQEPVFQYDVSDKQSMYGFGIGTTMDSAKTYAKAAIQEARMMGQAPTMLDQVHQKHGRVIRERRLTPGTNTFTMEDGTEGLTVSSSVSRLLRDNYGIRQDVFIGGEVQPIRDRLFSDDELIYKAIPDPDTI